MTLYILGLLLLLGVAVFFWMSKLSIEAVEAVKMTPWLGYEPGFAPGWGRKGCCNKSAP